MQQNTKTIGVNETASLCSVGRSTVTYWIREKKLQAIKSGKNYLINRDDLRYFLKSKSKIIPPELFKGKEQAPQFKPIKPCWEYWKDCARGQNCEDCAIVVNCLDVCFTTKESKAACCDGLCLECRYYQEFYLPRIQFIHQIEFPAAVFKDLYFWGGNFQWATLCQVSEGSIPGMGIEQLFHPESLALTISAIKLARLGNPFPNSYSAFLKNRNHGSSEINLFLFPIKYMAGMFLLLGKPESCL
jgi:excisionase family DNA binding protein